MNKLPGEFLFEALTAGGLGKTLTAGMNRKRNPVVLGAVAVAVVAGGFWFSGQNERVPDGPPGPGKDRPGLRDDPPTRPRAAYVGRSSCVECHAEAVAKWEGSHHFHAMELPDSQTVRGDFNGTTFTHHGVVSRFLKEGDSYQVETENESGERETFEIKYTFGWEPLQQYLVEFPDGRLQALPFCWDIDGKRWFHVYGDEKIPPHDTLFWTRPLQNWDHMCADCHSTRVRKKFDPDTSRFATSFSEINVSCEACHGPAERHVAMARAKDWAGDAFFGLADVKSDNHAQLESCAKCHARRSTLNLDHHAGDRFIDHFVLELIEPWSQGMGQSAYHPDGQIDGEVYVTGSFVQSKMFHKGVKCVDCHDPHTAKTLAPGNALCVRCHSPKPENPKLYDSITHHHHQPGTKGALCVECHMPEKTYMVVDPRRDHSIRVPRPDLSIKLGTPNACNRCHDEKNAKWAADWVVKWHGPNRPRDVRHADTFAAARGGESDVEERLMAVVLDAESPAFTRASALLALRSFQGASGFTVAMRALKDPDPLVRLAAVAKLEGWPRAERLRLLVPLLSDPTRAVRTEAARVLTPLAKDDLTGSDLKAYERAHKDLQRRFTDNLDRPEAHLSLGIQASNRGDLAAAKKHYLESIKRDEKFVPARVNLATLYNSEGSNVLAERMLREVTRLMPDWGDGFFNLGMLVAENPARLKEAAGIFETAAKKMPAHPRVLYNLGLSLWKLGEKDRATKALLQAGRNDPANPEYPFVLAQLLAGDRKWRAALPLAQRAIQLQPTNPDIQRLLGQISRNLQ